MTFAVVQRPVQSVRPLPRHGVQGRPHPDLRPEGGRRARRGGRGDRAQEGRAHRVGARRQVPHRDGLQQAVAAPGDHDICDLDL